MHVPCATCRSAGRCRDEELTYREAIFCWINGESLGCEDYEPRLYHGLEGVHDVSVDVDGGRGVLSRRDGGVRFYGPPLFLGTR